MTTIDDATAAATLPERIQVLTFMLDGEWFGVEIHNIQEVIEYRAVTPVPRTPDFMLGVINLRGKVFPVVDLRRHFDMQCREPSVDSCIIILQVEIDGEATPLGVLADRVQEVVEIEREAISPPPRIGNRVNSACIDGIARREEQFVVLLNLSRVFAAEAFHRVLEEGSAGEEAPAAADGAEREDAAANEPR
ncbi:MAG: chemotaxis protein CheW [Halomonas sp.]